MTREYFFFQAEDGIRDVAVTGVQTCALPISFFAARHVRGRNSEETHERKDKEPSGQRGESSIDFTGLSEQEVRSVLAGALNSLRDVCLTRPSWKAYPAPLKCHSVGRGTSVPTGSIGACA